MQKTFILSMCATCFLVLGCGEAGITAGGQEIPAPSPYACDASAPATRTISCVEAFEPGDAAGFGADQYPDVIYGEPLGNGDTQGSTDVLSLGRQGTIVIGFGGNAIVAGPGVDFIVFGNATLCWRKNQRFSGCGTGHPLGTIG